MSTLRDIRLHFADSIVALDAFNLFAGKYLGAGVHRTVFKLGTDETKVVKFEHGDKTFRNMIEWNVWEEVKESPNLAKWFAPCRFISDGGHILIQDFAADVTKEKLPRLVPKFFTDCKVPNWGKIGRHCVARDYGNNLIMQEGLHCRLRKAHWWGTGDT